MGMFDYFVSTDDSKTIQLKVGPCLLNVYREGSFVNGEVEDGVYYSPEGIVIVSGGVVAFVGDKEPTGTPKHLPRRTKWGQPFNPEQDSLEALNPVVQAMDDIERNR